MPPDAALPNSAPPVTPLPVTPLPVTPPPVAALPMYDFPWTAAAQDRLWALMRGALQQAGHAAPDALVRGGDPMHIWGAPDLLFAQTCSLPFRAKLAGQVALIATPDYGLEGCPPGHYRSVYVVRRADGFDNLGDVAGRPFAYNEALSHSGWAAPFADHGARGLNIRPALRTGAHHASALAVAQGQADYAALDALSWALIAPHDARLAQLTIIDHTPPSPALPYITAQNPAPLRAALAHAIAALNEADRATLHLCGAVDIPASAYLSLPIPPPPAG